MSATVVLFPKKRSLQFPEPEFRDGKVARETQYFADPFEPGPSRAQWVERME